MIYIENDGALFRGPARGIPQEVWAGGKFVPYKGQVPKDVGWGDEIDEAAAKELMAGGEEKDLAQVD